ncbi:MAG: hypothetical protein K2O72_01685 [Ligilactobacillus sp.]|nr:hypothetical protein [Ligilactobacillus sp.]
MILLDGLAAVIVFLALCRLVSDQAVRSVLYYYTISNYLMLFPYNRRQQLLTKQSKAVVEANRPLRRLKPKTKRQVDSELLTNLVKSFSKICLEIIIAPYYFMSYYFKTEK